MLFAQHRHVCQEVQEDPFLCCERQLRQFATLYQLMFLVNAGLFIVLMPWLMMFTASKQSSDSSSPGAQAVYMVQLDD